jgi:hypothetical protein
MGPEVLREMAIASADQSNGPALLGRPSYLVDCLPRGLSFEISGLPLLCRRLSSNSMTSSRKKRAPSFFELPYQITERRLSVIEMISQAGNT